MLSASAARDRRGGLAADRLGAHGSVSSRTRARCRRPRSRSSPAGRSATRRAAWRAGRGVPSQPDDPLPSHEQRPSRRARDARELARKLQDHGAAPAKLHDVRALVRGRAPSPGGSSARRPFSYARRSSKPSRNSSRTKARSSVRVERQESVGRPCAQHELRAARDADDRAADAAEHLVGLHVAHAAVKHPRRRRAGHDADRLELRREGQIVAWSSPGGPPARGARPVRPPACREQRRSNVPLAGGGGEGYGGIGRRLGRRRDEARRDRAQARRPASGAGGTVAALVDRGGGREIGDQRRGLRAAAELGRSLARLGRVPRTGGGLDGLRLGEREAQLPRVELRERRRGRRPHALVDARAAARRRRAPSPFRVARSPAGPSARARRARRRSAPARAHRASAAPARGSPRLACARG